MYITEQFNSFFQTIQSKQKLQFLIYTPSKYTYHLFLIQQLINKSLTCLVNSNLFHLGCFSVNIKPRYKLIRHSLLNFIMYSVFKYFFSTFFDYYISLCSLQLKSCQHSDLFRFYIQTTSSLILVSEYDTDYQLISLQLLFNSLLSIYGLKSTPLVISRKHLASGRAGTRRVKSSTMCTTQLIKYT